MTNTNLLKGKIKEFGMTQKDVAEKIGVSHVSLTHKLNNKREFTASEIMKMSQILDIYDKDPYFFAS